MSKIEEYRPNKYCLYENDATYPEKGLRGLNWKGRLKFNSILFKDSRKLDRLYKQALSTKECYLGPFWGEFGNFLLHFLPFVLHLSDLGIKVNVICLEHYKPFFRNIAGNYIYNEFHSLSKSLIESAPSANHLKIVPKEFSAVCEKAKQKSKETGTPFYDLSDSNLYWYSFRNWQLYNKQVFLDLKRVREKSNKVVLFSRVKGPAYTPNNGERLNYVDVANLLSDYFDEVVVAGLPEMSADAEFKNPKIVNKVGGNETVLQECAEAKLIVSQHSGAIHVGLYSNTPTLIIYKGVLPIKGLDDTLRFRKNANQPLYLATSDMETRKFLGIFRSEN